MASERVARKELDAADALDKLDDGTRLVVEVEFLGRTKEVVLSKRDGQYRCDTGFKVLAYDDPEEMKRCIERLRLVE